MAKTIRRGTKKFDEVLDKAKNVLRFDLESDFHGIPTVPSVLRTNLEKFRFATLVEETAPTLDGLQFRVDVHSNHWYEFAI